MKELEKNYSIYRFITKEERANVLGKGEYTLFPSSLVAGSTRNLTITYRVGEKGIAVKGSIKIEIPQSWTEVQCDEPKEPGYVAAATSGKGRIDLKLTQDPMWHWYITAKARKVALTEGDIITITYRGTVQTFPVKEFRYPLNRFNLYVDTDGKGYFEYVPAADGKTLTVIPDVPSNFIVTAPSNVKTGEAFTLKVVAVDKFGSVGLPYYIGTLCFQSAHSHSLLLSTYKFTRKDKGVHDFNSVVILERGIHTIKVADESGSISGESNPIKCENKLPKKMIYWASMHTHSEISDGMGTLDDVYLYARDIGNLSVAAVVDHAHWISDKKWEEIKRVAARYNEPRRFVTFSAYEWNGDGDHRVLYHLTDDQPIYNYIDKVASKIFTRDSKYNSYDTLGKLRGAIKGKDVMVVPHRPLAHWNGSNYHPELEECVEIYSMWGSSEYRGNPMCNPEITFKETTKSVQEMLADGARIGFLGDGDNHDGRPGVTSSQSISVDLSRRGGITGIFAPELTREAIFNGIKSRHTYATTGERILLEFEIDGHMMGEEFSITRYEFKSKGGKIDVKAAGTTEIKKIEVIRNNKVVYTHRGTGRIEEFEYVDKEQAEDAAVEYYYYIRVAQVDGNMAWSSPIWIRIA